MSGMLRRTIVGLAASCGVVIFAAPAHATGFTDVGDDLHPRDKTEVVIDGYWRVRAEALNNFDLDRGLTPSGQPLYAVPADDPNGQTLTYADMRLRTDLAIYSFGGQVAIKGRLDVLDNVAMGSNTTGIPAASTSQQSPNDAFHVKRLYGEVMTPIGLVAAGRMGNHWGLGMLANGGDCADCDSGDAQDRFAFLTPIAGMIFAAAYDVTAIGPTAYRTDGVRKIGLAPSTGVHTVTFAFLRWNDEAAHARRLAAGKSTVNFGAYASHRWQKDDAPVDYLPLAAPQQGLPSQIMYRGYTATALDAWARVVGPWGRVEIEAAYLVAHVDQPSLVPGVLYNASLSSHSFGGVLESELGGAASDVGAGIDVGYASGDDSPGFGARTGTNLTLARPGDLDGGKANPPFKTNVDNFRFHPDYRIDRILFREIIGTVTGAYYGRPHARWHFLRFPTGTFTASAAAIASWAIYPAETPGGRTPLGVEIDPTISYASRDGFGVAFEYAVLFPLAGFQNATQHLDPRPAQLFRVRLLLQY
jgi:uncharacterized protein (TIGR04551 family)